MPFKMGKRKRLRELQETAASGITECTRKTKCAYIVEAHESTRKRLEPTLSRDHEDHIAEKGPNSISHYCLVRMFFSDAPSDEDSGCESCNGQRMGEARKVVSVASGKGEEWERCALWKHKEKTKVHFATLMKIWHLKNAELEPEAPVKQRTSRVPRRHCEKKNDSGAKAVCSEQGSSSSQMTATKVMDVVARRPDCAGQADDEYQLARK